ncbi:MAG: succinate dehydrogenase / fumarate reductase cytochrome b subunit [Myxococcota bacterium]|jgi:succinate dehydrogenase / fumarate reductase cytochrome b subunit
MSWILRFYTSNIGLKVVMALTGMAMFGFLLAHLVGNLQIFWEPEIINSYAEMLHDHPTVLWPMRFGLIGTILAHIHAAVTLTKRSMAARPVGYRKFNRSKRVELGMRLSGVVVLGFIIYHLLHMTFGIVHSDFDANNVYHNVTTAFANPVVAIVYMVCNVLLGVHLFHGLWSMFRTLGVSNPRYDRLARGAATALTLTIVGGNVFMPLAILVGLI